MAPITAILMPLRHGAAQNVLELVIPPTNRLGGSVVERPACNGKVPGSIPGLAFLFSSYSTLHHHDNYCHKDGGTTFLLDRSPGQEVLSHSITTYLSRLSRSFCVRSVT